MSLNSEWERNHKIGLVLTVIVIVLFLLIIAFDTCYHPSSQGEHTLFIPSTGFAPEEDGITIFFDEPFSSDKIRVIADGEEYYIRLYPSSFYREAGER